MSAVPSLSSFRIRPCFEDTLDLAPDEARSRLLASFSQHHREFEVKEFPGFIGLHVAEHARRFWSPRLFIVLDPTHEGQTHIQGTYGPEIEVWSVFLYGYLITGLLGMFSGVLGAAQLFIHTLPWGFWVTGAMAVLAGILYFGAQLGQKFGAWQTFQLHQAYQAAVERAAGRA